MPGPAPPAGTPGPTSRRVDQTRSTRCRRAGGHGRALTSVHEGIALDEARVFTESRIPSPRLRDARSRTASPASGGEDEASHGKVGKE
ncbi:hypothetical protein DBR06_SOUSAS10310036 [Sousa chinensis]|uniref:Uncharacterized protein n=1 Tax=Sousa chinensis TaxID=103600 RepID=A0A484GWE9_SOUCH|nr:hypothetical protein DBR06_SOUSAS10310036 [Sousa chinensis]